MDKRGWGVPPQNKPDAKPGDRGDGIIPHVHERRIDLSAVNYEDLKDEIIRRHERFLDLLEVPLWLIVLTIFLIGLIAGTWVGSHIHI